MFNGQSPLGREARTRMLAMSAMALGQMMMPPEPSDQSQYRGPGKSITKAERSKRNVRKNIAKQSKKRNRRR
jgi:hypothetical protein